MSLINIDIITMFLDTRLLKKYFKMLKKMSGFLSQGFTGKNINNI